MGYEELEEGRDPARSPLRRLGIGLAVLVVGVVLTGQVMFVVGAFQSGGMANGGGASPPLPTSGTLTHRLNVILAEVLGSSDRGVARFRILHVQSVPGSNVKSISLTWAINNDLSGGTIGNGAQMDVYAILRGIYSTYLPITQVHMDGTYPLPGSDGRARERVGMRLSMDRRVATMIGKVGWDSLDAQSVWPLVHREFVDPNLQPQTSE